MRKTALNRTSVEVSALGLGAMRLSLHGRPTEDEAVAVVHRALDAGVTFIDTADAYCLDEPDKHHNERLLHKALRAYEGPTEGIVIATKGGTIRPQGKWLRNGDPEYLRLTIQESHDALGGKRPIPLWQHHAPDEDVPVEESLQAAREAVDEGLVRLVGVSNYSVDQIERARTVVEVVSVQNQYSLWHRRPEEDGVLAYCEREGLTFLPWGPLGGGKRSKGLHEHSLLAGVAREKGASPQQVALAWLMARSPCVLPIPGATRPESIEDSAQAPGVRLTGDEVRRLAATVR